MDRDYPDPKVQNRIGMFKFLNEDGGEKQQRCCNEQSVKNFNRILHIGVSNHSRKRLKIKESC